MVFSPVLSVIPIVASAYFGLNSYKHEFAIFYLMHSFCSNVQVYRLMIANMTKTPFHAFGLEFVIVIIPTLVHLITGENSKSYEPIATYICTIALFILFYSHSSIKENF